MANKDKTIDQLPQADKVAGNEMIPFAKDGANGKVSVDTIVNKANEYTNGAIGDFAPISTEFIDNLFVTTGGGN